MTMSEHPASGQHFESLKERRRAELPLSRRLRPSILQVLAILSALLFVYPLIWMAAASIKPNWAIYRAPLDLIPDTATWDAYISLFHTTPFVTYTLNSPLRLGRRTCLDFDGPCCRLWLFAPPLCRSKRVDDFHSFHAVDARTDIRDPHISAHARGRPA